MPEKEKGWNYTQELDGTAAPRVLHLGKRWYVLSADIDEAGTARGVRLDGPYADHETAEAQVELHHEEPLPPGGLIRTARVA